MHKADVVVLQGAIAIHVTNHSNEIIINKTVDMTGFGRYYPIHIDHWVRATYIADPVVSRKAKNVWIMEL